MGRLGVKDVLDQDVKLEIESCRIVSTIVNNLKMFDFRNHLINSLVIGNKRKVLLKIQFLSNIPNLVPLVLHDIGSGSP